MAEQIVARGGLAADRGQTLGTTASNAATKEQMGPPLSDVVLPQDKFSAQDVTQAKARSFPKPKSAPRPRSTNFETTTSPRSARTDEIDRADD